MRFANKLYYYDHGARDIYAYYLYDTGQMRPTEGVAADVRDWFDAISPQRVSEIAFTPVVASARNEVWMRIPMATGSTFLVLDGTKGEWLRRDQGGDPCAPAVYGDGVYSAQGNKILMEYGGNGFDGEFRGSEYLFNIINLDSDSNLKIPKFPVIFTLDSSVENDFFVEFTYDDNPERRKVKRLAKKYRAGSLVWVDDDEDLEGGEWTDDDEDTAHGVWTDNSSYNILLSLPGLLPYKQLQIRIFTSEEGQAFAVKRIEMKRVKVKTKTIV